MKKSKINQIITNHSNCFKPGSIISEATFCKWLNIPMPKSDSYKDIAIFNGYKSIIQHRVNKLLALRGLVIKSKNYYTEFHIQTVPNTVKYVKAKAKCGTKAIKTSATISNNMVIHGSVWTQLTLDELASVRSV